MSAKTVWFVRSASGESVLKSAGIDPSCGNLNTQAADRTPPMVAARDAISSKKEPY